MCLFTRYMKNPRYKANGKNGGIIPAVSDIRVLWVPIECGECIECKTGKARDWRTRLTEDIKTYTNAKFLTLTFSTEKYKEHADWCSTLEGYDLDNRICTRAMHYFRERWRKEFKKSPRHWFVTEIGGKYYENVHLHGFIWTNENWKTIEKKWDNGFIWKGGYVNIRTINYIVKYIFKIDEKHKTYKPIILNSPGIGGDYTKKKSGDWKKNKYIPGNTNETYRTNTGHKVSLPIYWRNKIYSDDEREKLWIEKLDKQQRYVLGQKIDISKTEKDYLEILKDAQAKNKILGYGNGTRDYNMEQEELTRRIILQQTRMKNNNNNK